MDGVPQVTQAPIEPGARFDYAFKAEDAGTFWYHPHQASFEQVGRGLYGLLIIDEPKPIEVDRELAWVLSDFKLGRDNQQVNDFGDVAHFGGGGRLGNVLALNGRPAARRLEVRSGERIRLRLLNASTARIFLIAFENHQPYVVSTTASRSSRTACGRRARARPRHAHRSHPRLHRRARRERSRCSTAATRAPSSSRVSYSKKPPAAYPRRLRRPKRSRPNPLPEPDLSEGGRPLRAVRGRACSASPPSAWVDGQTAQAARDHERAEAHLDDELLRPARARQMHEPLPALFGRGEHQCRLKLINDTEFEHPMHLHGHSLPRASR
jgi:hypothetical protein